MWDVLFKIAFYVVIGLVLIVGSCWYVRSLYTTLTGKGEVVIAPFEIIGLNGTSDKTRGTALAHMLQAQLREIEQNIATAQTQLMGKRPEAMVQPVQAKTVPQPVPGSAPAVALTMPPMPPLLTQGVGLQTQLLEPAEINVSVAGVEVGGVVAWLQRQMVNRRTVVFTLYEKKHGFRVTGALHAMGLRDDSMTLDVKPDEGEESVALDRVVEKMAYELVRRRLVSDPSNRVEALDEVEFQSLVEVLHDTARQNHRVALGRSALPEFQELLERASKLTDSVEGWYQLSYLTASIAESAQDWEAAEKQYQRAHEALTHEAKQEELRKTIDSRIDEMREKISAQQKSVAATGALDPEAEAARERMQIYVQEAVDYYNELLDQRLKAPLVKIQTDNSLKYSPYFDWTNVVADKEVQYFPDLSFRNAVWPHLTRIVGGGAMDRNDTQTDIMYSYADVFTMLAQQHHLSQDEKSSDWVLARGYIDWVNGKTPTKPYEGTPWVSFKEPGRAYNTKSTSGKDRQVAHMRDYVSSTTDPERRYINSGILNKAFYLLATKRTTERAAEIWIAALRQLKKAKRIDFPQFSRILYEQAGDDKDAVREALKQVGLDPV